MDGRNRRALLVGFSGAILLFAGLFALVGVGRVPEALATAEPTFVAATLVLALYWLAA